MTKGEAIRIVSERVLPRIMADGPTHDNAAQATAIKRLLQEVKTLSRDAK